MGDQVMAAACAGLFCTGCWVVLAMPLGWAAHRRMRAVETADGARAVPANEWPYIWYAGSALVWLCAAVLAVLGLAQRKWARAGRNCTFIALAHFTLLTVGVSLITAASPGGSPRSVASPVLVACLMVGAGALVAFVLILLFTLERARRISSQPVEGHGPNALERWAVYLGTVFIWPVGLIAAAIYTKPENVRVGMNALRITAVTFVLVALAVCVALPVAMRYLADVPTPYAY